MLHLTSLIHLYYEYEWPPANVWLIHVRSYPARADWDRHTRRTSSEVRCSTRLGARSIQYPWLWLFNEASPESRLFFRITPTNYCLAVFPTLAARYLHLHTYLLAPGAFVVGSLAVSAKRHDVLVVLRQQQQSEADLSVQSNDFMAMASCLKQTGS